MNESTCSLLSLSDRGGAFGPHSDFSLEFSFLFFPRPFSRFRPRCFLFLADLSSSSDFLRPVARLSFVEFHRKDDRKGEAERRKKRLRGQNV